MINRQAAAGTLYSLLGSIDLGISVNSAKFTTEKKTKYNCSSQHRLTAKGKESSSKSARSDNPEHADVCGIASAYCKQGVTGALLLFRRDDHKQCKCSDRYILYLYHRISTACPAQRTPYLVHETAVAEPAAVSETRSEIASQAANI